MTVNIILKTALPGVEARGLKKREETTLTIDRALVSPGWFKAKPRFDAA